MAKEGNKLFGKKKPWWKTNEDGGCGSLHCDHVFHLQCFHQGALREG
jgi:hypothetical protein